MIVAASYLDAVTFQICSQSFKIMPTALFAVWLLGQRLAPLQWASLPVLAVGVVRPAAYVRALSGFLGFRPAWCVRCAVLVTINGASHRCL